MLKSANGADYASTGLKGERPTNPNYNPSSGNPSYPDPLPVDPPVLILPGDPGISIYPPITGGEPPIILS